MIGYASVWWGQMAAFVGQMAACSVGGRRERYMYPRGGSYAREARGVVAGEALGVSKRVGYILVGIRGLGAIHVHVHVIRERHARSHAVGGRRKRHMWSHTVRVSKRVGIFLVGIRGPGAIHVIRERHARSHAVGGRYMWSHTMRARRVRGRSEQSVSGVLKRVGILC